MQEQSTATKGTLESRQLSACEAALALARRNRLEALRVVRGLCRSGTLSVRKRVAQCLMEMGGDEAIIGLIGLLKDPHHEVRIAAAGALGVLRAQSAKAYLERLLESDPHLDVQLAAARTLGRLQDKSGLSLVLTLLNGNDERYRRLAVVALRDIIGQRFSPDHEGIESAKRYLQVQGSKFSDGG